MYKDFTQPCSTSYLPITDLSHPILQSIWNLPGSTDSDKLFRESILTNYPNELADILAKQYQDKWTNQGRKAANLWLLEKAETLPSQAKLISASYQEIKDKAKGYAEKCSNIRVRSLDLKQAHHRISEFVLTQKYTPAELLPNRNLLGLVRRMCDEKWWRKQIEKTITREYEALAIEVGLVHSHASCYISDETRRRASQKRHLCRETIETLSAISQDGEVVELQDLIDGSPSNPKILRAELMVRCRGFEEYANKHRFIPLFFTITAPSRFHAALNKSGQANPKYNGSTPRDTQDYLTSIWGRIRAKLHRKGIHAFGFRVAEPHHDGTPHWHLLLFVNQAHKDLLIDICRDYALRDCPDEYGADKYRFKVEEIDPKKGSATGYIAKYISKNIDGHGLDEQTFGENPESTALDAKSWASTWGIRQFQQIGGPSVEVWRQLRKIRIPIVNSDLLEACRLAADEANWMLFCELMGGAPAPNQNQTVKLFKAWSDKPGIYGEVAGNITIGVTDGEVVIETRLKDWLVGSSDSIQRLKQIAEKEPDKWRYHFNRLLFKGMIEEGVGLTSTQGRHFPYKVDSSYKGRRPAYLEFCQ
ncbi:MAG: replication endonuclease [Candidatus Thiodiazotropha sp. 6PLUC7]